MPKHGQTRHGSLQFYPRVRAKKLLPRVSWSVLKKEKGLMGFIGYKVGMANAFVKDAGAKSLTKGKRIVIPVTILEFPSMKIFSVRFYKDNKVVGEVISKNADSELKKVVKLPKKLSKKIEDYNDFDDLRVLVYSQVKKTGIKKKPDIAEIGLAGSKEDKIGFVKDNFDKEISIKDIFNEGLVDIRGVTIGKGTQGPTKRFGLTLRSHKSEKGIRGPGSGGPWHPARVEYTQPMAGQMGYFSRVQFNNKIISFGNIKENDINPNEGFKRFGKIKGDYMIVAGSVLGPVKRQLLITVPLRASRDQLKKNYEFIELR